MDTTRLKKFAQYARRSLIEQVESKLKLVLAEESEARREHPKAVAELEKKLKELGQGKKQEQEAKQELIEQVAYTWFNRFCALRFMDVNQYNRIMVISPLAGQFQPEILAEAKAGHIDEGVVHEKAREKIFGLLNGSVASRDGQSEAFRQLIVAVCNDLHRIMPYLFARIDDYSELLMPDDLLSGNSILAYTREAMTPEACESVESIGWLYQFYISEKKDEVFDGLKKNKKITPENIPAATQLFTPHWIVRYLVENSLGRLWMLNNPNSKVIEQMDYYIKPVEEETDFLRITSPEEIKICDPACGSGHMLTYAYDLLYAIYLDAGYDSTEISEKILTNNLYGIEIDERAAELAAFALTMKAVKGNPNDDGNNRRRFFRNPIEPNICRLENITISDDELDSYIDFVGKDLFTQDLRVTLKEFEEANNFGSLIQPTLKTSEEALAVLEAKDVSSQLFLALTHQSVLKVLRQADCLRQKYHVVIANPPYMSSKGMGKRLSKWIKDSYEDAKTDLFSAFIERSMRLCLSDGQLGFMTPFVWMFLSSYEKLRVKLIESKTLTSLVQLEYSGFDGATVPVCTFTFQNGLSPGYKGGYIKLSDFKGAKNQGPKTLEAIKKPDSSWFYRLPSSDFIKMPGSPIAFWVSSNLRESFQVSPSFSNYSDTRSGLVTGDNDHYIRQWSEVSFERTGFNLSREEAAESSMKWFPLSKGGDFRRWYGNHTSVIDWSNDGNELRTRMHESGARTLAHNFNLEKIFLPGISWTKLSSGTFGARIQPLGFLFHDASANAFPHEESNIYPMLAFLCSKLPVTLLQALNPTLNFLPGNISSLPLNEAILQSPDLANNAKQIVKYCKDDWDSYEISWGFKFNPILALNKSSISLAYDEFEGRSKSLVSSMKSLEERNNQVLIDIYGLESDLDAKVSLNEITVDCNPKYRYANSYDEHELDSCWKADTVIDLISYSIGCMFGRYSLDKEALVLANQGDTLEDYLKQIPSPSFQPDDDNVIPLIDFEGDWFEDDITERFKEFLKVTFGEEHFAQNLAFIEEAIGKDIKKFFLKDFYTDHVKRYKKRPIYWLFTSPKGSFNALIYMHRYNKDTVSIVLNDYLREFRTKLQARKDSHEQIEVSASASAKEKTQAMKAIQKINKVLDEINDYEHDTLYPLAGKPPEIDLDDGVKHNYPLFGKALRKVTGLS